VSEVKKINLSKLLQVGHPCGQTTQAVFIDPKDGEVYLACPKCKKVTDLKWLIQKVYIGTMNGGETSYGESIWIK